jgi:signal transduction histidine kinase
VAKVGWLRGRVRLLLRPSGTLPPVSLRGRVFDVLLALSLFLLAIVAGDEGDGEQRRVQIDQQGPRVVVPEPPRLPDPFLPIEEDQTGWTIVLFLAVVLPLVFRRRYPLSVLWIVLATAPLVSENDAALRLSFYACVIAAYSAAIFSPYRIPALASLPLAALLYTRIQESAVPAVPDNAVPFLILVPIAIAASGLRRWKLRADEDRERLSTLEREQAEALRRAAEHERARIARELHDVVTHNVSMMVIQAGAARKVMDASPEQARDALLAVESGGRAAMAELRHVMGLLTMDSDGLDPASTADLAPQPGLDRLGALVQRVRDTGLPVDLVMTGQPVPVQPGIELTAYRVVQEALTNTVKHAAGASAKVRLDYLPGQLRVEVTDTGGTPGASAGTGDGHGLIGLRERLAVYGGTLHAGRRLTGGYRIAAEIPLEEQ